MKINGLYYYKGKLVIITDGQYAVNGRLSNFWSFRYIKTDGSLGRKGGDYDNEVGKFKRATGFKLMAVKK